jgi:cobalt-zinc-cadmium efflux system membrane fusion protein
MHSHDIHESRALYQKALADSARMKGIADYSMRVRDRAKRLYDLKAGSLAQLERAETELRNAQTDAGNAEIEVARTRNHITEFLGISADLLEEADSEDHHDLIPVRSPAAGVVLKRDVTPGTVVTPSDDLFLVSDLGKLWAMAQVQEEYLGKLRVGMPVRVFVQAYPQEAFLGRIGRVGETLDPATRTVQVRVEVQNSQARLKPEMYATTEIQIGVGESALTVPSDAVQEIRGQTVLFVKMTDDCFEVRPVRIGRRIDSVNEVVAGLKPGEAIAIKATFILKSEFLKAALAEE